MRVLLQRVSQASVTVEGEIVGTIEHGFLILLGIGQQDSETQVKQLVDKIVHLRIFEDEQGKMNLSLLDTQGAALVVSQFTLYADTHKGRRPSFTSAAPPVIAEPLVEHFKTSLSAYNIPIAGGIFGADMAVSLINDGPVTIWLDSEEL